MIAHTELNQIVTWLRVTRLSRKQMALAAAIDCNQRWYPGRKLPIWMDGQLMRTRLEFVDALRTYSQL